MLSRATRRGRINLHFLQGDVNDDCKVDIGTFKSWGRRSARGRATALRQLEPKSRPTYERIVDIADLARVGCTLRHVCP